MRTNANHEPTERSQVDTLNEPREFFAEVVGRALAEAWRQKWNEAAKPVDTLAKRTMKPTERGF